MIAHTCTTAAPQGSDRFPGRNRFPIRFQSVPANRFRPYYVGLGADSDSPEQIGIAPTVRRSLAAAPAPGATRRTVPDPIGSRSRDGLMIWLFAALGRNRGRS